MKSQNREREWETTSGKFCWKVVIFPCSTITSSWKLVLKLYFYIFCQHYINITERELTYCVYFHKIFRENGTNIFISKKISKKPNFFICKKQVKYLCNKQFFNFSRWRASAPVFRENIFSCQLNIWQKWPCFTPGWQVLIEFFVITCTKSQHL